MFGVGYCWLVWIWVYDVFWDIGFDERFWVLISFDGLLCLLVLGWCFVNGLFAYCGGFGDLVLRCAGL